MTPPPYTPRDLEWHDHSVAAAASAWMHEPRDTEAYRRLVEAVTRRRAFLQPTLPGEMAAELPGEQAGEQAGADVTREPEVPDELLDELGAERGPERLGNALDDLMSRLRAGRSLDP